MSQIDQLKAMQKDLLSRVKTLKNLSKLAGSKLNEVENKKINETSTTLRIAMDKAMKGDSEDLNKFIKDNANIS